MSDALLDPFRVREVATKRYPEWDYVIGRERSAFCSVKEHLVAPGDGARLAAALLRYAPLRKRLERSALRLLHLRPRQVYLQFDAKQATIGNRQQRIKSFCVGLDANAEASVRRIFGEGNYLLLDQLETLPHQLAQLYLRLSA